MKDRIHSLRKTLNMTQDKFGEKIGLARNTIANYECGRRVPTNAVITSICREFNVNEIWLRTGEGGDENMFTKVDEDDRYSLNLGKLSKIENQTVRNMVNTIAEASPEKLKYIEEFMKSCLGINKE